MAEVAVSFDQGWVLVHRDAQVTMVRLRDVSSVRAYPLAGAWCVDVFSSGHLAVCVEAADRENALDLARQIRAECL